MVFTYTEVNPLAINGERFSEEALTKHYGTAQCLNILYHRRILDIFEGGNLRLSKQCFHKPNCLLESSLQLVSRHSFLVHNCSIIIQVPWQWLFLEWWSLYGSCLRLWYSKSGSSALWKTSTTRRHTSYTVQPSTMKQKKQLVRGK